MFALIKTKGATEIAIQIPGDDTCSTSLKQLALMLENNATFFKDNWSDFELIQPEMAIVLGDQVKLESRAENGEVEVFVVPAGSDVLDASFQIATPEVQVSYAKAKKELESTIKRLRHEKESKDLEIQQLKQRIEELSECPQ
ncbi:MAG: hypothetical protein EBV86_17100 [Marivivens sp.]|nr:hypothetical protein [Marivivens sp.]